MTEELAGVIVGGVIGIAAALIGSAVTMWLTMLAERRKERQAREAVLVSCRLEVASVASALHVAGAANLPPLIATRRIIDGMLAQIDQTTARELLLFSILVHDLGNTNRSIENLAGAFIAAGEGKTVNPTLVEYRRRSEQLAKRVMERAEVVVRLLGEEITSNSVLSRLNPPVNGGLTRN